MVHECISFQKAECDNIAPLSGLHVRISWKAFQQIVIFSERYAKDTEPTMEWREVYGILLGEIRDVGVIDVDLAVPMKVGNRVEVTFEAQHYEEISRIQTEIDDYNKNYNAKRFIVGWWHSHPNLGIFYSSIDAKTQLAYQTANPLAIGIVYDPTERGYNEPGFRVLRLDEESKGIQSSREQVAFELHDNNGVKIYTFPKVESINPLSSTDIVSQTWVDQILNEVENLKANLEYAYHKILIPRLNKLQSKYGLLTPEELGLGGETKKGSNYRKKVEHIIEYGGSLKTYSKRQAYGRLLQNKLKKPFQQAVEIKVEIAPILDHAEIYRDFLDAEERLLMRRLIDPINLYFNTLDQLSERAFHLIK